MDENGFTMQERLQASPFYAKAEEICRKYGIELDWTPDKDDEAYPASVGLESKIIHLAVWTGKDAIETTGEEALTIKETADFERGILQLLELTALVNEGKPLKISNSTGGKVEVTDKGIFRWLKIALHTWVASYKIHPSTIATQKIKAGEVVEGLYFNEDSDMIHPFHDSTISSMLKKQRETVDKVRLWESRNKDYLPSIGTFAADLLVELKELPVTDRNNLIGELLEASGILDNVQGWEQTNWIAGEGDRRSARRRLVDSWVRSYERVCHILGIPCVTEETEEEEYGSLK